MMLNVWITIFVISSIETGLLLTGRAGELFFPILGIPLGTLLSYGALSLEVATSAGIESNPDVTLVLLGLAILSINAIYLFSGSISAISAAATGGR